MPWLGELRQYADVGGGTAVPGSLAVLLVGEGRLVIATAWPDRGSTYLATARRQNRLTA